MTGEGQLPHFALSWLQSKADPAPTPPHLWALPYSLSSQGLGASSGTREPFREQSLAASSPSPTTSERRGRNC